jgi:hypothetical protein
LIELIAHYYHKVISAILEANLEGPQKLSVLIKEWSTGNLTMNMHFDMRIGVLEIKLSNNSKIQNFEIQKIIRKIRFF